MNCLALSKDVRLQWHPIQRICTTTEFYPWGLQGKAGACTEFVEQLQLGQLGHLRHHGSGIYAGIMAFSWGRGRYGGFRK